MKGFLKIIARICKLAALLVISDYGVKYALVAGDILVIQPWGTIIPFFITLFYLALIFEKGAYKL